MTCLFLTWCQIFICLVACQLIWCHMHGQPRMQRLGLVNKWFQALWSSASNQPLDRESRERVHTWPLPHYITVFMLTSWFICPLSERATGSETRPCDLFLNPRERHWTIIASVTSAASFGDGDASLTVVYFERQAGDLLCDYHHGPGEKEVRTQWSFLKTCVCHMLHPCLSCPNSLSTQLQ